MVGRGRASRSTSSRYGAYGSVEIYFQWLRGKPPFDDEEKRAELLERLNRAGGIELPANCIDRRPTFPIEALSSDAAFDAFASAIEWEIAEVRGA